MNTKIKCLLLIILICLFTSNVEAFLDIFTTYGRRNNQIDTIIRGVLDTPNNKWKRSLVPISREFDSTCEYIPEKDDKKKPNVIFSFTELHHAKHPNLRILDDFFLQDKRGAEELNLSRITIHSSDGTITKEGLFCDAKLLSRTDHSICSEIINYKTKQKCISKTTQNLFGEQKDELICLEPEIIDKIPTTYFLTWIVDLGNNEFREYMFWAKERQPTNEERIHLLELFQRMEDQIKNVKS